MSTSRFPTTQYPSTHFTDSAGAILFHLSTSRVCLVHLKSRNEYVLPKGRRNIGESRASAALREITEETGYPCRMLKVRMQTRAPPAVEPEEGSKDEVRVEEVEGEPFMVTLREVGEGRVKMIWWFVAMVEEHAVKGEGEEKCGVEMVAWKEAGAKLTFREEREVLERAVAVVRGKDGVNKSEV
jgi:8-oxo-dGTP pyrophosphatase MutT (NUDIX family)